MREWRCKAKVQSEKRVDLIYGQHVYRAFCSFWDLCVQNICYILPFLLFPILCPNCLCLSIHPSTRCYVIHWWFNVSCFVKAGWSRNNMVKNTFSPKWFRARKHNKQNHSQNINTEQVREWERFKVGLSSALLKIDCNRRVAISRAKTRLRIQKGWWCLSNDEKIEQECSTESKIPAQHDKQKEKL